MNTVPILCAICERLTHIYGYINDRWMLFMDHWIVLYLFIYLFITIKDIFTLFILKHSDHKIWLKIDIFLLVSVILFELQ